jgi:hypothetical protein
MGERRKESSMAKVQSSREVPGFQELKGSVPFLIDLLSRHEPSRSEIPSAFRFMGRDCAG